ETQAGGYDLLRKLDPGSSATRSRIAKSGPTARCDLAGRQCENNGTDRRRGFVPGTNGGGSVSELRYIGGAIGGTGHLRRLGVLGGAAHQGDRNSYGSWGGSRQCAMADRQGGWCNATRWSRC